MRTTASPLAVASAYASGLASRFRAPFARMYASERRSTSAHNAAIAGTYAADFLCAGLALGTDRFSMAAAQYARRAWREAVAAQDDATRADITALLAAPQPTPRYRVTATF